MNIKMNLKLVLSGCVFMVLAACGGGSSSSGGSEGDNAKTDAGELTGVYSGSETISLINEDAGNAVSSQTNEVVINISRAGVVSVSTSGGSSGSAQLRNNNTFQLIADARTQFNGLCESGEIQLDGNVATNTISAVYRSVNLLCQNIPHRIEGNIAVSRGNG